MIHLHLYYAQFKCCIECTCTFKHTLCFIIYVICYHIFFYRMFAFVLNTFVFFISLKYLKKNVNNRVSFFEGK